MAFGRYSRRRRRSFGRRRRRRVRLGLRKGIMI
uniref:Uncharacterized protein n=1 Tax=Dulem virus 96 TaxID=3145807 RepID=A0AAU8B4Q8_9VIRU